LLLAAEHWDENALSERYIEQALEAHDGELEVLVSAYRYYFYKSRSERALALADRVLERLQRDASLPRAWEELRPTLMASKDDPIIRLYLAAYAARGLLLAKLGRFDEARLISSQVKEFDDGREFCAGTVFDVLTPPAADDDVGRGTSNA
jgi:tetratricopeptide (TPR) repeat protein